MSNDLKLWAVLVPTVKDAVKGKYYTLKYHRLWDAKVRAIAGGLTILPPVKGQWVSPTNELFAERMIPVQIACTEPQIEHVAKLVASHYDQEAVMYYVISERVIIKHFK